MNLRRRVFVVLVATVVVLLAVLQFAANAVVSRSFDDVERSQIAKDMKRARDGLQQRIVDIETKGFDWSVWDDLWIYCGNRNKAFAESNLPDASAQMLKLDMLIVFANDGSLIKAVVVDRTSGKAVKPHPRLYETLAEAGIVGKGVKPAKLKSGIVLVGEAPLLFTAQQVFRSNGSGPTRGVVFMGRLLDDREVADIAKLTHLDMSCSPFSATSLETVDNRAERDSLIGILSKGSGMEQRAANANTAQGFVRVDSIANKPVALLTLKESRDVHQQGVMTISLLRSAILLALLALATAVWLTLEKTVLRRLARLSGQVSDIGASEGMRERVDEGSNDELGKLARAINEMVRAQVESRRQIEESAVAVRKSEERLNLAIQGSKATIWDWDVASGNTAWFGLVELLGYEADQFPTTLDGFLKRVHPDDVEPLRSEIRSHLDQRTPCEVEIRVAAVDGTYRWLQVTGQAVWDDQGNPMRVVGTAVDIDQRKAVEAELNKFFLLVEKSEDLIAMASLEGAIAYINPAGRRAVGLAQNADIHSMTIADFYPDDLASYIPEVMLPRTIESGAWEGEIRFKHFKGGPDILMHETVFTVNDPATGTPLCFATVSRDITAEKKNAQALAKARDEALASTRAKATFLANMSHEIRTPMNGVIGMTELLLDTPLSEEQRDFASIIQGSAEALLGIINDILDFSKIEAGKMEIDHTEFNLRTVLEEVSFLLAAKAHAKNLELICHIPPGLPEHLIGDPTRVRQVVMNLLGNATKFTEVGEILLQAEVLQESVTDLQVRISVKDTGIGIASDRQDDIFESFTQADGSSSRRYCGTGLGLTICRQLAGLMGGSIGVKSELGKGSTFWIDLPFRKQEASAGTAQPSEEPLTGVRALIVDDNPTNRMLLREYLKAWGCRSAEAAGGLEAVEMLQACPDDDPFQIVLLDMQMPDLDGEGTAKVIRGDPRYSKVGIVLLTSMGMVGSSIEGRERGFDATLVKPIHQSQLFNAMANILDRKPSRAEVAPEPVQPRAMPLEHVRILLVEDNAVNRKVATRILDRFGCEVKSAGNGVEALKRLAASEFDLILMDCQMPEMDGYEATREIRTREAATKGHQPIIAMTASALEGDREKCLAAGMDDYVAKPVKPHELLETIIPWVKGAQSEAPEEEGGQTMEVLDRKRLSEVCGDDEEFAREVVAEYLDGVGAQIAAIKAAVEAKDCLALAAAAHALKGASRTIGGGTFASICEELEICGRQGVEAGLDETFKRALAEFAKLQAALMAFVQDEAA